MFYIYFVTFMYYYNVSMFLISFIKHSKNEKIFSFENYFT